MFKYSDGSNGSIIHDLEHLFTDDMDVYTRTYLDEAGVLFIELIVSSLEAEYDKGEDDIIRFLIKNDCPICIAEKLGFEVELDDEYNVTHIDKNDLIDYAETVLSDIDMYIVNILAEVKASNNEGCKKLRSVALYNYFRYIVSEYLESKGLYTLAEMI